MAVIAAVLLGCGFASAAPPPGKGGGGGGGGAGSNGGGVIYFRYEGDLYTMNDDGSGIGPVAGLARGYGAWRDPSYQLHGGKRWFLQFEKGDVVAVSDSGDSVTLALQEELGALGAPRWRKDDGLISFEGRVWDMNPESQTFGTVVEGGLYGLYYTVDPDGNLTASNGPAVLLFPADLVPDSNGDPRPDMEGHDWAPDGLQFVFDRVSKGSVEIGDISTGEVRTLHDDPTDVSARTAYWSPAGHQIAFHRQPHRDHLNIMLINADGSGLNTLVRGSPNWTRTLPVWSPTGSHLLYHHTDHFHQDSYIIRVTADGTHTRITDKSMALVTLPLARIGWRE